MTLYPGEPPPERPCVYFIQCTETLAVKIGWTKGWPRDRMAALQTSSPWVLDLIYGVPSARKEHEASWHRVFASRRIRGEWYRITEREVMDAINAYYDLCGRVDRDIRPVPDKVIRLTDEGIEKTCWSVTRDGVIEQPPTAEELDVIADEPSDFTFTGVAPAVVAWWYLSKLRSHR